MLMCNVQCIILCKVICIMDSGKFLLLDSRILGIGIPCMCGIRISVSGIRNPQHGIQDPRLSEITLHDAECVISNKDNVNITLHCMLVQCEMDGVQTGPRKRFCCRNNLYS